MGMTNFTHTDLCHVAGRWLRGTARCGVVLVELTSAAYETPDAIGWRHGISILVEVKMSRSDFFADKRKPHRMGNSAMGDWRFYLTPQNLLSASDLPAGWGLLEFTGKNVRKACGGPAGNIWGERVPFNADKYQETLILASALRRQQSGAD